MNDLHHAVCIGIDRYPGLRGRDLGAASSDAQAFAAWLTDPAGGGLPPENVVILTSPGPADEESDLTNARPRRREVNRALHRVNTSLQARVGESQSAWQRTRLYLYAAGHGIGPPNGDAALLMADAEASRLGRSIDLSRYVRWYLGSGIVHELVVFADCCRELVTRPVGISPPFRSMTHSSFRGTVRYVGYACRLGEVAWEPSSRHERDRARGYFTRAVLAGLRSAAASPETGEVTAGSLAQYVEQAMERLTQGIASYPQSGEHVGDVAARIILRPGTSGTMPAPPIRAAKIRFPAGYAGEVVLRSGSAPDDLFGRWLVSDGAWSVYLPEGVYRVEPAADGPALRDDGVFTLVGGDEDVQL